MKISRKINKITLVGLAIVFIILAFAGPVSGQTWTELFPTGGPPEARNNSSAVYDEATNRMIVFGGIPYHTSGAPPLYNDVWVLTNADGTDISTPSWTELSPTGSAPSARGYHSAVYDPDTNRMIVFGGDPQVGYCGGRLNDVWILENANGTGGTPNWIQLSPTGGPPSGRGLHSALYEPDANRMIIFGGDNACEPYRNDTWVLENANGIGGTPNWIQLAPTGTLPDMNHMHSAAYDAAGDRMIVFVGFPVVAGVEYSHKIHVLEGASGLGGTPHWSELSPEGPSFFREGPRVVYNPESNRMILHGGIEAFSPHWTNDVLVLSEANGIGGIPGWTLSAPTGGPPAARDHHSVVYNPTTDRMTIFGGRADGMGLNDVWVLAGAGGVISEPSAEAWIELLPTGGPPEARNNSSAVYDEVTNRMIVFGGIPYHTSGAPPLYNDVWVLTNADGTEATDPSWTELSPTGGGPSARGYHSAVYDPDTNRMIIFGGDPHVGYCWGRLNDVWILENANGTGGTPNWIPITPTGGPPSGRGLQSALYDQVTNRMIIFGGDNACEPYRNDTWVLENANSIGGTPNWIQLAPTGTLPDMNHMHSAAYDAAGDRMIIFVGFPVIAGVEYAHKIHVLEGASGLGGTPHWSELSPEGPSFFREGPRVVYNPESNRMILHGGIEAFSPHWTNDVLVLSEANGIGGTPEWALSAPTGGPPTARDHHSVVYNPTTDRMTIFGGRADGMGLNDVWVLAGAGRAVNEPPVAEAGSNQSIHVGQTVDLDGSGSSDDATPSEDLDYLWSFTFIPPGSTTALVDAGTVHPSFLADLSGDYVVSLVVTDEGGLSSEPDEVIVSSLNTPPTADAGPDQGAYIGTIVTLDGSASGDPDCDPLTFDWTFLDRPMGSETVLYGDDTAHPTFFADLAGSYIIELIVNDGYEDSAPDGVTVAVITAEQFAEGQAMEALNVVTALPPASVTTKGNQTAFGNFLLQVIESLQEDDLQKAVKKLESAIERTDGCALRGSPDEGGGGGGNPPAKDYVNNCGDQAVIYPVLVEALNALVL